MSIGKIIEKLGPDSRDRLSFKDSLTLNFLRGWVSASDHFDNLNEGKNKKTSFQHNISLRNLVFPKKEKNIDANCILILKKSWEAGKGDEKRGIFVGFNKWIHFPWKQFFFSNRWQKRDQVSMKPPPLYNHCYTAKNGFLYTQHTYTAKNGLQYSENWRQHRCILELKQMYVYGKENVSPLYSKSKCRSML